MRFVLQVLPVLRQVHLASLLLVLTPLVVVRNLAPFVVSNVPVVMITTTSTTIVAVDAFSVSSASSSSSTFHPWRLVPLEQQQKQRRRQQQMIVAAPVVQHRDVTSFQNRRRHTTTSTKRRVDHTTTTDDNYNDEAEMGSASTTTSSSSSSSSFVNPFQYALLFDCDGVILETEEYHRLAYNAAFQHFHLTTINTATNEVEPVIWSVEYYDTLQNTVGGGKPKMYHHFRETLRGQFPSYRNVAVIVLDDGTNTDNGNNETTQLQQQQQQQPPPTTVEEQATLIDQIQAYKTQYFTGLLQTNAVARPGVLSLMDAAFLDPTIAVGVCSAATKAAAIQTLNSTLGPQRVQQLNVCLLGDDVPDKKPHPTIYNMARETLNIPASHCIVIEDSMVGLRAAIAAQMKCIITYTNSTAQQDFYNEGAAAKVPNLQNVTLQSIFNPLREHGIDTELLVGVKD
jgi:beta-phosphoglucomutase-like phosphatase (HAD superfamily)